MSSTTTTTTTVQAEGASKGAPLKVDKDNLGADSLDLDDEHVTGRLGLFVIHNVVRRNLLACADNVKSVTSKTADSFRSYASYTLFVLEDQLLATDTIWFPAYAKYDDRFQQQIATHGPLKQKADELKLLLPSKDKPDSTSAAQLEQISKGFRELHALANHEFDIEESLSNQLGHSVPVEELKELAKKQDAHRNNVMKEHGQLWSTVYLLRSLASKERDIFPPGMPKAVAGGMLTTGALKYRKESQWAPKF